MHSVLTGKLAVLCYFEFFGLGFLVLCCEIHRTATFFCTHKLNEITHKSPLEKPVRPNKKERPAGPKLGIE